MDSEDDSEPPSQNAPMVARTPAPETESVTPDLPQYPRISSFRDVGIRMNSRRRTINPRGYGTGWIDHDPSGDYDPILHRTPPRRPKRVRTRTGRLPGRRRSCSQTRRNSGRRVPVGYRYVVILPFKAEKSLKFLRSITPGPASSKTDSDDDFSSTPSGNEEGQRRGNRRKLRRCRRFGRSTSVR